MIMSFESFLAVLANFLKIRLLYEEAGGGEEAEIVKLLANFNRVAAELLALHIVIEGAGDFLNDLTRRCELLKIPVVIIGVFEEFLQQHLVPRNSLDGHD